MQITARPTSFAPIEGPTRKGFIPYMDESLTAYATGARVARQPEGWVWAGLRHLAASPPLALPLTRPCPLRCAC